MYKNLLLFPLLLITGCAGFDTHVGVSFNDEKSSAPEVHLPNPLGIIRIEYETERSNTIFCEHISSIPTDEKGDGLNHCGFMFQL